MARSIINPDSTDYIITPTGVTVFGRTKSYPNITKRNQDSYSKLVQFAWVDDATEDPTVNKGSALYKRNDDGTWTKLYETESMDIEIAAGEVTSLPWSSITDKPDLALADHNHDGRYATVIHEHLDYANKVQTQQALNDHESRLHAVEEEIGEASAALDALIGVL